MAAITIKQGTTPTITVKLPTGTDTSAMSHFYFALRQYSVEILVGDDGITVDGVNVSVFLPQTETVKLTKGKAQIDLDWTYPDHSRGGIKTKEIDVDEALIGVVLE